MSAISSLLKVAIVSLNCARHSVTGAKNGICTCVSTKKGLNGAIVVGMVVCPETLCSCPVCGAQIVHKGFGSGNRNSSVGRTSFRVASSGVDERLNCGLVSEGGITSGAIKRDLNYSRNLSGGRPGARQRAQGHLLAVVKLERRAKEIFGVEVLWRDQVMRVVPDIVCDIDIGPVQQLVEALGRAVEKPRRLFGYRARPHAGKLGREHERGNRKAANQKLDRVLLDVARHAISRVRHFWSSVVAPEWSPLGLPFISFQFLA